MKTKDVVENLSAESPLKEPSLEELIAQEEKDREYLKQQLEIWIDTHVEELELAQKISQFVADLNLVDESRRLPFQVLPTEDSFIAAVHLDHPVFEHFWIKVVALDKIIFEPLADYWTIEKFATNYEDVCSFIKDINDGNLEKFGDFNKDAIDERRLFNSIQESLGKFSIKDVNTTVEKLLKIYRDAIDPKLNELKRHIGFLHDVWITSVDEGTTIPLGKLSGKYDQFLLHNPCLLSIRDKSGLVIDKEKTQKLLLDKIEEFIEFEVKRSVVLYDVQTVCTNAGYVVEVSNNSYLEAIPGKTVKKKDDGSIELRYILQSKYIQVHSKLENFGSNW